MSDIKITTALISGLFALLGAFTGALMTRRTEYGKWLRQQRSLEFSEFIRQFEEFKRKAIDIRTDHSIKNKDLKITELLVKIHPQESIVRLYLNKEDREFFSKQLHEFWDAYSPAINDEERHKKHKEITDYFKSLFEKTIDP